MKSCAFFGHKNGTYMKYEEYIGVLVAEMIEEWGYTQFYSTGRSPFDCICARTVSHYREQYPLKNTFVYSYIPKGKDEYGLSKIYDDSVYFLDKPVPPRFAIIKTNEAIIDHVDTVLVAVDRDWGGAWNAMEYARRKKKKIINIYDGYTKEWDEHMATARWFRKIAGLPDPEEEERQKIEKLLKKISGR